MRKRLPGLLLFATFVAGIGLPEAWAVGAKIGGSGPYDRPTNHTGLWCANAWSQALCAAPLDSFVADGDSAFVRFTVRNTQFASFLLDNVVVVERSVYEAYALPVGELADSEYICARFAGLDPVMLDLAAIPPQDIVYLSRFDTGIGPEWSFDAAEVTWQTTATMFDDPFAPELGSTTGHMAIGDGDGPSPLVVELTLPDVTAGTEYVLTYWSNSIPDEFPVENCVGPNNDWEAEIFGAEQTTDVAPLPPGAFARLGQNHPNPFNPRTRIQVDMLRPGYVELSVLDARGRRVGWIHRGGLSEGIHDFTWGGRTDDGRDVAAGAYFYRLRTPAEEITRRMILLK